MIVCLGSTAGTIKDVVDELRDEGEAVGLLQIHSFRPFPAGRSASRARRRRVGRSCSTGRTSPGGAAPLYAEIAAALYGDGPRARELRLRPRRPRPPPGRRCARSSPASAAHYVGLRSGCMSAPEDARPQRARRPAAARRPRALPGLRDPDGRAHDRRLDRRPGRRRQRDRLPRGRDHALPDHRLEPPLDARRVRERRRGRRAASRPPTGRSRGAGGCPRTTTSRSSSSAATAAPTTSASRRSRARSSAATVRSSSATTTRRT